jgi:hypothetical protein
MFFYLPRYLSRRSKMSILVCILHTHPLGMTLMTIYNVAPSLRIPISDMCFENGTVTPSRTSPRFLSCAPYTCILRLPSHCLLSCRRFSRPNLWGAGRHRHQQRCRRRTSGLLVKEDRSRSKPCNSIWCYVGVARSQRKSP